MCLSCYDDKMAQPPLCHWPPPCFLAPLPSPGTPPQDTSQVEGSVEGKGKVAGLCACVVVGGGTDG